MKKRIFRWVVLLAIGFGIGSIIGFFQSQKEEKTSIISVSPDSNKSEKEFTLIDHNGNTVTQNNYVSSYKLIFFGFTFCPAVCPTELQKINVIMDELGALAENITPIFISIDPERDNPEVMKNYISNFHPKMVGLTGSFEQIDAIKKQYNVYAKKVENEMMDEYMMDHSSFLYFMSPSDELIALYPAKDSAVNIAQDIKDRIN